MTNHNTAADLSQFEAAPIFDAGRVEVVLRRRGPAILARLPYAGRYAVVVYTATVQAVTSGGASVPRDTLSGGCSGGAPAREGRGPHVLDQVEFLRHMEAAVGADTVVQAPVDVHVLDLWRRVCLGDMPMEKYLARLDLKPAKSRMTALNQAFEAAASRVADAIGATRSPFKKGR